MILKVKKLLKKYNVITLKQLSKKLKISLNRIKNISCGRTSFLSLFQKRGGYRIFPKHSEELAELIV
jgi:DNA-directed RNA polymerase sigma subunit (sigma70/sigma32)